MNYDNFLELVKKRRSIRRFRPNSIPDDYIDRIIEAARWAPSGGNSQSWEFIVVKKQELKDSIVKIWEEGITLAHRMELTREPEKRHPAHARPPQIPPGFAAAPVFIILCGDPRTKSTYPLSGVLYQGESIFISSLANAFIYMHLAATALGLGSQWITSTSYPFEQSLIKELLGIPFDLEVYDMVALGYPDTEPRARPVRNREEMVHYDYYKQTVSNERESIVRCQLMGNAYPV